MGSGKINIYVEPHSRVDEGTLEIRVRIHRGDVELDTTSPVAAGATHYADLKSAAQTSQASFDDVAEDAWGGWYTSRSTPQREAIRYGFGVL